MAATNKRGIFALLDDVSRDNVLVYEKDVWLTPSPFRGAHPFGYFAGGYGVLSSVDRLDYSNDTDTASLKGPLSDARQNFAATGNENFGYFGGGRESFNGTEKSLVDRIDYSNDTATASPKGPLSSVRRNVAATGNTSFGYFGGGDGFSTSTVDRIDYSNDTATASPKGPLSVVKYNHAATGNADFWLFWWWSTKYFYSRPS